jgi:hypothetical protein
VPTRVSGLTSTNIGAERAALYGGGGVVPAVRMFPVSVLEPVLHIEQTYGASLARICIRRGKTLANHEQENRCDDKKDERVPSQCLMCCFRQARQPNRPAIDWA